MKECGLPEPLTSENNEMASSQANQLWTIFENILRYISNKTPAMHRDIFRLQLANNRVSTKNLPPQK